MSYFLIRFKIGVFNATPSFVDLTTQELTYVDNFASTLFDRVTTKIDSNEVDNMDNLGVIDTALHYSNCRHNFLKTFGSLTRIGEPLMQRLQNVKGTQSIECVFRPCCSLFDTQLLPPGAQFQFQFNWATNALNCLEYITPTLASAPVIGKASTNFNLRIDQFVFYKATLVPSPEHPLPDKGIIELTPSTISQTQVSGSSTVTHTFTVPGNTNRLMVVMRDVSMTYATSNADGYPVGAGDARNPSTSWTLTPSSQLTSSATTAKLTKLTVNLPEIGQRLPDPTYTPSWTSYEELLRMYADFVNTTQGTRNKSEGSIPFGRPVCGPVEIVDISIAADTAVMKLTNTTSLATTGDSHNIDQYKLYRFQAVEYVAGPPRAPVLATLATDYLYTAINGWCRRPTIVFPIVRPGNKHIGDVVLDASWDKPFAALEISIISTYSMALAVEHIGGGIYKYDLLQV